VHARSHPAHTRSTQLCNPPGYNGGVVVGPPTAAVDTLGRSRITLSESVLPDDVIDSAMEYAEREGLLVKVRDTSSPHWVTPRVLIE
jgi:hypothetical protein